MIIQEQVDRAYRVAYRLVFPVVQRLRGLLKLDQFVVVAVGLDDTVLAVRHSYKPGLTLLYGGARRREDHRQAAARELQEEVGITINPDTLRLVMATPNMHLYELRLTEKPELLIDRREIPAGWATATDASPHTPRTMRAGAQVAPGRQHETERRFARAQLDGFQQPPGAWGCPVSDTGLYHHMILRAIGLVEFHRIAGGWSGASH